MERSVAGAPMETPLTTGQTDPNPIVIHICPTTGGQFDIQISRKDTIDGLKRLVAKKLKIPKERISLLYRDRLLKEGCLWDNHVLEGCRITLLPNVESGLMSQKPENSVMQALENLTDNQVNDFLSGKSPLTLAMRLGDHMMFVQLQLSTSPPNSKQSLSKSSTKKVSSKTQRTIQASTPTVTTIPATLPAAVLSPATATSSLPTPSSLSSASSPKTTPTTTHKSLTDSIPILDSAALAEASRNLSLRLKELSQMSATHFKESCEVPSKTSRSSTTTSTSSSSTLSTTSSSSSSGAIIESMHHHGQGVYSGTFSGTLNPALQDKDGKPKRNISTIIHILNDLLGATPQYRAQLNREKNKVEIVETKFHPRTGKSLGEHMRMQQENLATRGKMEQLQMMLEERRQRRRARREARSSPYTTWSTNKQINPAATASTTGSQMEVDANLEASNMSDNVADTNYNELKPETVVA